MVKRNKENPVGKQKKKILFTHSTRNKFYKSCEAEEIILLYNLKLLQEKKLS